MKTKLTPLEELRREKEIVRRECAESGYRLAEHWSYLSNNVGSLLFQSGVDAILKKFGFGSTQSRKEDEAPASNNLLGTLNTYYPVVWEIVQPLLWNYLIKKIKSIFSGKKKKKRRNDDD
ncbi:MAG: hypothetical protein LBN74_08740 [Prevotella sp.]|jgi:hypothetical protein|nr:hypothetical protein [Prevotella sp.]